RSADCFGEAHIDLRFDPNTMRAQTLRLDLGKLVADSADLLDPSSIEETQTDLGHGGPSWEAHWRMQGRHRETRRSIRMPSVIGPRIPALTAVPLRQSGQTRGATRRAGGELRLGGHEVMAQPQHIQIALDSGGHNAIGVGQEGRVWRGRIQR